MTGSVLVVGGAGCIGSHVARALADAGNAVTILDDFSTGHRDAVSGHEVLECDLADATRAREALGWRPRFPDLDTIVAHAWAFERGRA